MSISFFLHDNCFSVCVLPFLIKTNPGRICNTNLAHPDGNTRREAGTGVGCTGFAHPLLTLSSAFLCASCTKRWAFSEWQEDGSKHPEPKQEVVFAADSSRKKKL